MENSISKRKVLMKEALYREKLTELESCSKYVTAVSHYGDSVTDAFWIARNQLKRVVYTFIIVSTLLTLDLEIPYLSSLRTERG
ncbi:hypothetical protein M514_00599 [Trichuris suis]|uniref:Uncharacterized protein n=1 Tax=Trichuris suis TaxID=68888 RepID=A0A085MSL5_9BILA|nr:hypothetical protein M514_00599 [Trichuris suis]